MTNWIFLFLITLPPQDANPRCEVVARMESGKRISGYLAKRADLPSRFSAAEKTNGAASDGKIQRFEVVPRTKQPVLPRPFTMHNGSLERLQVSIHKLEDRGFRAESILGERVIPMAWISAINGFQDGIVTYRNDFSQLPAAAQISGAVRLSQQAISLPSSLAIDENSSFVVVPEPPFEEGRFTCYFLDSSKVAEPDTRAIILSFGRGRNVTLRIDLASAGSKIKATLNSSQATTSPPIARKDGWRKLSVAMDSDSLIVAIDEEALISNLQSGLHLPLTSLQFERKGDAKNAGGPWLIDDVALVQKTPPVERIMLDPTQIDVLDENGDQWFGQAVAAKDNGIVLKNSAGHETKINWHDLRSIRFPDAPRAPMTWNGEIGDLSLRDGSIITCALKSIEADRWIILHPVISPTESISVSVNDIAGWSPRIVGKRTEIVRGPVHLGNKLVPEFENAMPAGLSCKFTSQVDDPDRQSWLSLWIVGIEGIGPKSPFAAELKANHLITELIVNGKRTAILNQFVQTRPTEPIELRLPLRGALKAGENTFELKLTKSRLSEDYDESEVQRIALEQADAGPTNSNNKQE